MKATLKNSDSEERYVDVIGDMGCSTSEYFDDMNVDGVNVGQVRLNFETNGDGVAFKIKDRRDSTLAKGGERNDVTLGSGLKINFDIPTD